MRILARDDKAITIELGPTESRVLQAALGEVCFGFSLKHFDAVVGAPRENTRRLCHRLDELNLTQLNQITVSRDDLRVISNAHCETLRELGVEEYSTRTGVEFSVGQALAHELHGLMLELN